MSQIVQDDDSEKGFDDPLLRKSSLDDPLSSAIANEDALSHTPRSSRRTEKSASDERAEAAAAEWDGYKASIMQRFTSSGTIKVSIVSSSIQEFLHYYVLTVLSATLACRHLSARFPSELSLIVTFASCAEFRHYIQRAKR